MANQGYLQCKLLLLLIISLLCSSSCFSQASSVTVSGEEKVELELYYETLCPYCSRFIVKYLNKIFDNGLIDIINLKLIPYGNAKINANGTIKCQHGPDECLLNTIEACAIHVWPDVNEHFPFVYCVEKLVYEGEYIQWGTCFEKLGLDRYPVDQCYASGLGKELELAYAEETNALQPPHRYVPWVTVDGEPLYDDYQDFMSFICKNYKGSPVPTACSELSTGEVIKLNTRNPSSHTVEKIKLTFSWIRSALRTWIQGITAAGVV